jgi:hypothetical protein
MTDTFTPTNADVAAFLELVPDPARRQDCLTVLELMRRITKEEPRMWGSGMVGFGTYHYRYESGREGESFVTGFSPRKDSLTIYIMPGFLDTEPLLKKLGKHKTGKSCLYIKQLGDVDIGVLERLIANGVADVRKRYAAS